MTALADALRAAQAQAIATLSKAYLAEATTHLALVEQLDAIGCTDKIEQGQLVAALDTLHSFGGQAPEPTKPDTSHEPASDKQLAFLRDLADKAQTVAPDGPLTREQASKAIDQLKAGTYNPDEWTVPF